MGLVQFRRLGFDLFLRKTPGHVPDHLLFFGQFEIHDQLNSPLNSGFLFSRKAVIPSLWSGLVIHTAKPSASM